MIYAAKLYCAFLMLSETIAWSFGKYIDTTVNITVKPALDDIAAEAAGLASSTPYSLDISWSLDTVADTTVTEPASQMLPTMENSSDSTSESNYIWNKRTMKKGLGYFQTVLEVKVSVGEFCKRMQAGSYGNPNYDCTIYHVCQDRGSVIQFDTMPCPEGLRFSDREGICDWPRNVNQYCNAVLKPRKLDFLIANPMENKFLLDIRLPKINDGESMTKTEPVMGEKQLAADRISRMPFYIRRMPVSRYRAPTSHKLPYLHMSSPVYLGYRRVKNRYWG